MTLLSPPIAGNSMEVKLASQKWRQLQNKTSRSPEESTEDIDLDAALLGIPSKSDDILSKLPETPDVENKKVQQTKLQLPILSGILRNTDIHGRAYATAVIDGLRLKENDRIQGFKIQEILKDGVVVTSGGQKWFLSAPNVAYSRVYSSAVEGNDSQ